MSSQKAINELTDVELTVAIAVQVMGWTKVQPNSISTWGFPPNDKGFDAERAKVPEFATDIAAAFQVVERMRELKFRFSLGEFKYGEVWRASFGKVSPIPPMPVIGDAATITRAICLAALEAVRKMEVK